MPSPAFFTSARERRLWGWALASVAAVYGTLGMAGRLAGLLGESGLGAGLFVLASLLVLAAVVTQGLGTRPGGAEIGVALGIAAVYLLLFTRMSIPAERSHLIEYGVVALLVHEALAERASRGRRVRARGLLAVLLTVPVSLVDECLQLFVPGRVFDPTDLLFNLLAAVMAVASASVLGWARGLRTGRQP